MLNYDQAKFTKADKKLQWLSMSKLFLRHKKEVKLVLIGGDVKDCLFTISALFFVLSITL